MLCFLRSWKVTLVAVPVTTLETWLFLSSLGNILSHGAAPLLLFCPWHRSATGSRLVSSFLWFADHAS